MLKDCFKMNLALIWLFIITGQAAISYPVDRRLGTLNFEMHYENKHGVVSDGSHCDSFVFNRLCDIFFDICITSHNGIPPFRPCNFYTKTTSPERNAPHVIHTFQAPYFTTNLLDVKIKAFDYDHLSAPDLLGEFHFTLRPSEVPTNYKIPKFDISSSSAHPSTTMKLYLSRTCGPDRFGNECKLCKVENERGYCDKLGNLVCYPGYYGDKCSSERECYNMTCASFAQCGLVLGGYGCVCDGTSGERCEEGYDPCAEHICWNGGTCVPTGEHSNFAKCVNCSARWGGLHCDELLDGCTYEEFRLGHPPCLNGGHCVVSPINETEFICICAPGWQGQNCEISLLKGKVNEDACDLEASRLGHPPCENGGHCIVDRSNETMFSCLCAPGWQGPRCDVSFSKASAVVTIVSIILLVLIICFIIGLVCCIRIFALPKIRQIIKKQKEIEMTQVNGCEFSAANNLYQFMPGQIRSPLPAYTATWTKEDNTLVKITPQIISKLDDDKEYEYEAMLDPEKCYSAKEVSEFPEEEDYEPINYKYQSTLKSEAAMSAANNEYGDGDNVSMAKTLQRPLPSTPAPDGEDYEFLCKSESGKD